MKNIFSLIPLLVLALLSWSCKDDDFFHSLDEKMEFTCPLDSTSEYILVIGDIQDYTYDAKLARKQFRQTMDWAYAMHRKGYQIDAILQTGDLTNNDEKWQYEVFEYYTKKVAEQVLYVPIIGNHDYTWGANSIINNRQDTRYNQFTHFANLEEHVVKYYEEGRLENIIVKTTVHSRPFYILALEYGPRPDVLQWAAAFVSTHPDDEFLLMTHEYISRQGQRINDAGSDGIRQFSGQPATSPETIWQQLVFPYNNVRCVLCGHNGFSQRLFTPNAAGREVPQILFNLQYLPNGGDGYIMVWELPKGSRMVKARTISTFTNEVYSDSLDEIFNPERANYDFEW